MAEPIVDVLLAGLLLLTVVWCVLLYQRLRGLRLDRAELSAFVDTLSRATERAEQAVAQMRAASEEAARAHREQQEGGRRLREELGRASESALRMVRRLEAEVGRGAAALAEARAREDVRPAARPVEEPSPARGQPEAAAAPGRTARRTAPKGEAVLRALAGLR